MELDDSQPDVATGGSTEPPVTGPRPPVRVSEAHGLATSPAHTVEGAIAALSTVRVELESAAALLRSGRRSSEEAAAGEAVRRLTLALDDLGGVIRDLRRAAWAMPGAAEALATRPRPNGWHDRRRHLRPL